jgi:hypothetical protein
MYKWWQHFRGTCCPHLQATRGDAGRRFLQNIGSHNYMVSQPRRPQSKVTKTWTTLDNIENLKLKKIVWTTLMKGCSILCAYP